MEEGNLNLTIFGNINDSVKDEEQWKRNNYAIIAPILAILGLCATLLNVYVLLSALFLKRSASINLWFSLSLAAVDTYSAALIVVNLFLQSYLPIVLRMKPHHCLLIVSEMLRLGGLITSVLHLLALALTHFLGVLYPLKQHAWIASKNRRIILLVVLWVCPSMALFISMASVPDQAFLSPNCRNLIFASELPFRSTVCVAVAAPMLTTFAFYFAILWRLKLNDRDPVLKEARPTRQNKKLFFTMVLLMGTFLLGWFPSLIFYILYCDNCPLTLKDIPLKTVTVVAICVQVLIILKLFSNPLIYALRISELRYALSQLNQKLFGIKFFALIEQNSSTQQQQHTSRQCQMQRKSKETDLKTACLGSAVGKCSSGSISMMERQKFLARFDDFDE